MSRVPSVDPLSATMISRVTSLWLRREQSVQVSVSALFSVGTTTPICALGIPPPAESFLPRNHCVAGAAQVPDESDGLGRVDQIVCHGSAENPLTRDQQKTSDNGSSGSNQLAAEHHVAPRQTEVIHRQDVHYI